MSKKQVFNAIESILILFLIGVIIVAGTVLLPAASKNNKPSYEWEARVLASYKDDSIIGICPPGGSKEWKTVGVHNVSLKGETDRYDLLFRAEVVSKFPNYTAIKMVSYREASGSRADWHRTDVELGWGPWETSQIIQVRICETEDEVRPLHKNNSDLAKFIIKNSNDDIWTKVHYVD